MGAWESTFSEFARHHYIIFNQPRADGAGQGFEGHGGLGKARIVGGVGCNGEKVGGKIVNPIRYVNQGKT